MGTKWLPLFIAYYFAVALTYAGLVPEKMPSITTNQFTVRSMLVTSNWLFVAAAEPTADPSKPEAVIYARPRPGAGKPTQRILPRTATSAFGSSLAMADNTLLVKDAADTYFFRHDGASWVGDGLINGDPRFTEAIGPITVGRDYFVSGMELYSWPGRQLIQVLNPTGDTNHEFTVRASSADYILATSYAGYPGVFLWSREAGGSVWTNFVRLPVPPDAGDRFGETLFVSPLEVFAGAPSDAKNGPNAGAVYIYRSAPGWPVANTLRPTLNTVGDEFGSQIAPYFPFAGHLEKIYISAPHRAESRQQAGAFFAYGHPDIQGAYAWWEFDRIALPDTTDAARLGKVMVQYDNTVYATSGSDIYAFHQPVSLNPIPLNGKLYLNAPNLEATSDLNGPWTPYPEITNTSGYESITNAPARFFRTRATAF